MESVKIKKITKGIYYGLWLILLGSIVGYIKLALGIVTYLKIAEVRNLICSTTFNAMIIRLDLSLITIVLSGGFILLYKLIVEKNGTINFSGQKNVIQNKLR